MGHYGALVTLALVLLSMAQVSQSQYGGMVRLVRIYLKENIMYTPKLFASDRSSRNNNVLYFGLAQTCLNSNLHLSVSDLKAVSLALSSISKLS